MQVGLVSVLVGIFEEAIRCSLLAARGLLLNRKKLLIILKLIEVKATANSVKRKASSVLKR